VSLNETAPSFEVAVEWFEPGYGGSGEILAVEGILIWRSPAGFQQRSLRPLPSLLAASTAPESGLLVERPERSEDERPGRG
jgi:hypothetical protein